MNKTPDIRLVEEITSLSPFVRRELLDFLEFLKRRYSGKAKAETGNRMFDTLKGRVKMNDNFDDPIEGFEPYV